MPFVIPVNVTLLSGAAGGATITIDNDSDFDLWQLAASSILATGVAGLFAVSIFDELKSKPFTTGNALVNGENWFGTGAQPFTLPASWRLYRQSKLIFTFLERSAAAVANTVQLALHGYKVNITQP
jgi:hypothetical protein